MTDPFKAPAPGFDDPLGLLMACHERILGHCETLDKLPAHWAAHGCDDELRQAAKRIHHYFSTAGKLHHQDEEEDLFPRVVRTSIKIAETVHRLRQEHQRMDAAWQALEPLLARPQRIEDEAGFAALCSEFTALYRQHIQTENAFFLDKVQHLLSSQQLKDIGKTMAARRRVEPESW